MKLSLLLPLCGFLVLQAPRAFASALLKPTSGVTQALAPKSLSIDSTLQGAFAKTTLTTVYSNPNNDRIEADFLYSAPKGCVVTGFAYWYGEEKVVARVVEKGRAAKIYQYITSRMRDPALIEMIGKNAFRARIFPVEANTDLKIEIQLAQTLSQTKSGPLWSYPLREETQKGALQNVKIQLHSASYTSSNLGTFKNGHLLFEKRNFKAKDDARALVTQKPAPIRASLIAARDGGSDGFFALSLTPSSPITRPIVKISGVLTYEVLVPQLNRIAAGQALLVVGRYRGTGQSVVALNGQSLEVRFPDTVEKNNLASQLWAANRIEALSENPKNMVQVMALSKRFGVPSKWTSWLAIPEEERKNFKRQMWASDRSDAARSYAQAMARADQKGANAQKVIFDALTKKLVADGSNYAEEEELQPLSSYLNDELRHLQKARFQAKYSDKVSKTQLAQWQTWEKNLKKAGAKDGGKGVDLPVYVIEDEMRIASRLLMQEIEVNRNKGAKARTLKARLKELAQTKTAREYGWDENTFLDEQAEIRVNALAMDIAANRISDKPNPKREASLKMRLQRLDTAMGLDANETLQEALQAVWNKKMEPVAQKLAKEIEAGRADSPQGQKLARELGRLQQKSGLKRNSTIDNAWYNVSTQIGIRSAPAIQKEGTGGPAAKRLESQITLIAKRSGRSRADVSENAWNMVGSDIASKLSSYIRADQFDTPEAQQLQANLRDLWKRHKLSFSSTTENAWRSVEEKTAQELAKEIIAKREQEAKAKQLTAKLDQVRKRVSRPNERILRSAWENRAEEAIKAQLQETLQNGDSSPRAQQLKQEAENFVSKSGVTKSNLELRAGYDLIRSLNSQVGEEIAAKRENGAKLQGIHTMRERLLERIPALKGGYGVKDIKDIQDKAWEGRAHESAYQLLAAEKTGATEKIPALQEELDMAVQQADKKRDAVVQWEKTRLAKNEPLITAEDYRLRPGDPLISVLAPSSCRQVVALMPDGTLLPLRYEAHKHAWEAHFDVPMSAAQGDYRVQIVIVAADGSRKRLTMNFAVDLKAPKGTATLQNEGNIWHLRLETDEQTDRVTAFLPWNERIELRRNVEGVFAANVVVPTKASTTSKVRFILTDRAHNRTEVSLNWK